MMAVLLAEVVTCKLCRDFEVTREVDIVVLGVSRETRNRPQSWVAAEEARTLANPGGSVGQLVIPSKACGGGLRVTFRPGVITKQPDHVIEGRPNGLSSCGPQDEHESS